MREIVCAKIVPQVGTKHVLDKVRTKDCVFVCQCVTQGFQKAVEVMQKSIVSLHITNYLQVCKISRMCKQMMI